MVLPCNRLHRCSKKLYKHRFETHNGLDDNYMLHTFTYTLFPMQTGLLSLRSFTDSETFLHFLKEILYLF